MNIHMDTWFRKGIEVISILEQNGHQAYFVGGCVRDRLLQRPITDIDLCTSAKPDEVMQLFTNTIPTGIQHGTVSVIWKEMQIEVTTFRSEGAYRDRRHPEHVQFETSLEKDIQRRDFTINALAMDKKGHMMDYVGGSEDLHQKLIRTVGLPHERFNEDALRIIRAIRFSAQLGFTIESHTYREIKKCRDLLQNIALERISVEFQKIMKAEWIKSGIIALVDTGISQVIFPFTLLSAALKQLALYPLQKLNEVERWALLLTLVQNEDHALSFLRKQVLPKQVHKQIKQWVWNLYQYSNYVSADQFTPVELIHLGFKPALGIVKINNLLLPNDEQDSKLIEKKLHTEMVRLKERYSALPIQRKQDLAITGKDLIDLFPLKKQGRWIQRNLDQLVILVVTGKIDNERAEIIAFLKECQRNEYK